jgi:RimJ/RimL family protein N-acetyltransferase
VSELPPQIIELRTPNFVLRTLQPGDEGPELESWTLDPIVAEMMNAELKTWSIERQRSFFATGLSRPDRRFIGIFPAGSAVPIGVFIIKLNVSKGTFVVSTLIGDKSWRGKNVITECADEIYRLLFMETGFHKGKANVLPTNKAMIWLMAQSAWRREGRLRKHLSNSTNKERLDVLVYGLLKPLWLDFITRKKREGAQANDGVQI